MKNNEETRKIRFAIIGCGNIGKKHLRWIRANDNAKIVAVIDIKEQSDLEINLRDIPYFQSLDLFFDSAIAADVITIATPNYLHSSQAIMCLEHGFHVAIEKPISLNLEDAIAVQKAEQRTGKKVFVVLQNRYSPLSVWIKGLVSSGHLGRIYMVQINCFWNRDERYYLASDWKGDLSKDGGTLFTQYSHFIDIMLWLFGDIKNIRAKFQDYCHHNLTEFEDSGIVTFDFVEGGNGILNFSTAVWNHNMESSLTILAENGAVKIAGQYMERLEFCEVKDYELPDIEEAMTSIDYGSYQGSADNHQYVIENIIEVLNENAEVSVPVTAGVQLVDVIQRIYEKRNLQILNKNVKTKNS